MGMVAMKSIARSYIWWPKVDSDIEAMVKSCEDCQRNCRSLQAAPLYPWKWPTRVWQRIHVDFAEKDNLNFLVLNDVHSKWIEVEIMRSTTAPATIGVLRNWFAAYGLPENLVSDSGPQFISQEFSAFMHKNGIKHTLTPPYHPATNGSAERAVQTLKRALSKSKSHLPIKQRVANFLIRYRNTPHSVTGVTPAELFLKRKPRTRFTLLLPNIRGRKDSCFQVIQ